MFNNQKVVVTMTSWSKRIGNCVKVIQSVLDNTVKPDIVFMNLSLEEFPNRLNDLPKDLVELSLKNPRVKIGFDADVQTIFTDTTVIDIGTEEEISKDYIRQRIECHYKHVFLKFIIPCWGVKNEIGRMLDSILCQTFTDYHIVCVDDCSSDGTWDVLKRYADTFGDKITLIRNKTNIGAGASRNIGYFNTLETINSQYIWFVDGDDYISNQNVVQTIYDFACKNKNIDIINIGWTHGNEYSIAKIGWPVGLPGRVIKPEVYVPGINKNIPLGNDVYSHFIMFDNVPDEKIGELDYNCYIYPKPGRHINNTDKTINIPVEIGKALMNHKFKKSYVVDALMNSKSGTGKWIQRHYKEFKPKMEDERKISILMASFPFRKKWMLKCIDDLFDQCDNFYLWLNQYTEIPKELLKYDQSKMHIHLSTDNLKENGRYLFFDGPCKDDYCFICDDDINYPTNYVQNTIDCFKRNGDNIVVAYYIHSNYKFMSEHKKDSVENTLINSVVPHYRFGLGVTAFIPSIMNFQFTNEELIRNYDIEMFVAQQCVDNGIRVITPKRPDKFVRFIRDVEKNDDVDKYALHLNGSKDRILNTYNYMVSQGMVNI